jgi:hypothetical protein
MNFGRKPERPVDRALAELEQKIAAMEQEIRRRELQQPAPAPGPAAASAAARRAAARRQPASPAESATEFVRRMITPGAPAAGPAQRARRDLFDIPTDPLKELEADLASPPRPAVPVAPAAPAATASELVDGAATPSRLPTAGARPAVADARLISLLRVGTLRTNKPLKHVQRKERNMFWKWLGLAFALVWILYVLVR